MIANPSAGTQTKFGTYVGSGGSQTISTGFTVGFVCVIGVTAGRSYFACDTGNNGLELTTAPAVNPGSAYCKLHATDGFTVSFNANTSGQTYYYFACQG